tara:strand:+ start:3121 stop:4371 length:1251 start_codon:yes stop_codon:yes gene_type:complete
MSFNWPTTGFTGTEVEAFETAYKELAEEIISTYNDEQYGDAIPLSTLYAPYKNADMMEFLLQEAFLYASFIIKQRSGNTGPGTDFDLSSSPFKVELPRDELGNFYKNLGCVFDKQEMIDAWNWNKDNNPNNWLDPLDPTGVWDGNLENLIDNILNAGEGEDPLEDLFEDEEEDARWYEEGLLTIGQLLNKFPVVNWFIGRGKYFYEASELTRFYLRNDKTPWTENRSNFSSGRLTGMKKDIQRIMDRGRAIWPTFHSQCGGMYRSCTSNSKLDITSQYTESEKAQYQVPSGGKIYEVSFYATSLEIVFGTARVVTDASGEVMGVYDDFDFAYGNEIRRETAGNGIHGMSYNNGNVTHGSYYNSSVWDVGNAEAEKADQRRVHDEFNLDPKRKLISGAHYQDRGLPVPIRIHFGYNY